MSVSVNIIVSQMSSFGCWVMYIRQSRGDCHISESSNIWGTTFPSSSFISLFFFSFHVSQSNSASSPLVPPFFFWHIIYDLIWCLFSLLMVLVEICIDKALFLLQNIVNPETNKYLGYPSVVFSSCLNQLLSQWK